MDREVFDVNNIFVQMLMVVHLQQLQISGLSTLAYSDLEQYLSGFLWKRALPSSLHEAADDVLPEELLDSCRGYLYSCLRFDPFRKILDRHHRVRVWGRG